MVTECKASCSQDEVPGGQRGVVVSQSEEIPEDPLLAETHYSQYEDFESSHSEDVSAVSLYRWCTIDAMFPLG